MNIQDLKAERERILAELHAMPGPKPIRPIPADVKAEALADVESEDEWRQEMERVQREGGRSFDEVLAAFDRAVEAAR